MIFIYNLIFVLLTVLFLPFILLGLIINKKWRMDLLERFCIYKNKIQFKNKNVIWFHAASVGEVQALIPVIKELKNIINGYDFVVTTTSINGKKKIKNDLSDTVLFFSLVPLDLFLFTNYFINKINPQMVVFIETELWPNLIFNIYNKKIPLLLINGRISDKSYPFYKIFSFLFGKLLDKFLLITVQSEKMAKRFMIVGKLNNQKIIVLPNTKFSLDEDLRSKYEITEKKNKKIIIAGSIREGEEELIIKSFNIIKEQSILIIAPRYLKRVKEIIKIALEYNLKYELWTNLNGCNKILEYELVILNTIGELTNFYSIGDIAIVGGGFLNYGGHNPIEPASFGLPVITGKNMYNFEDTMNKLVSGGGTVKLNNMDHNELQKILHKLIENDDIRISMGQKNKNVIENYKSSADTTALIIKEILIDKKIHKE
ncbi:MAG: hypothetical protein N3E50_06050 [Candidatus Goldbacteria bacterium]|nr:hypothetical protein [Candidatus Goldiibacteriota bacterium]